MSRERKELRDWILPKKPARLLVLFTVAVAIFATDCWRRRWSPEMELRTEHYVVYSTASPEQTQKIADVVEMLYGAYRDTFAGLLTAGAEHIPLKLKLFRDRAEFRRCNRGVGWAEAFYRYPYCYAYYPAEEVSPYHWMVHEVVHQLNREVAGFDLAHWADEGIAAYFSTSEIRGGRIYLGRIDPHTYPIWGLGEMELTGDLDADIAAGRIIPLEAILSGRGGPDIDKAFNLYYIHWWSLSHFLFHYEGGKYKEGFFKTIPEGAAHEDLAKHCAPIPDLQQQWYAYLREILKKQ